MHTNGTMIQLAVMAEIGTTSLPRRRRRREQRSIGS